MENETTPADLRRGFIRSLAINIGNKLIAWGGGSVATDKPLRKCAVSSSSGTLGTSTDRLDNSFICRVLRPLCHCAHGSENRADLILIFLVEYSLIAVGLFAIAVMCRLV
jgi:hypothetical protein